MADQQLDIIIKTQLEAAGFEATKQQIAEVKSAMEANGGMNLEALRGFTDGVEQQVAALLKRKEAIIDGAIGAKMQADAAAAECEDTFTETTSFRMVGAAVDSTGSGRGKWGRSSWD